MSNIYPEIETNDSTDGGGGSSLTVEEGDGSPSVSDVDTVVFPNGTVTDDGSGQVTISLSGSGDVTAGSNFGNDNRLIRSDGTGKGVQASGVTLDDSDNVSGLGTLNTHTIPAGTGTLALTSDLHSAVTLAGNDYLTLSGQEITAGDIDLADDVTGNLPVGNLNSGTNASSSTFWRGDGVWATPAGSGDVSGPASSTDNAIARFDGTSGTVIQNSGATISDAGLAAFTALEVGGSPVVVDSDIGTNVQAHDAGLDDIAALAVTDGNFIVGDGTNWVAESGSTARTSLGLGSAATEDTGTASGDVALLTTGGVFADARISESSVTQHEAALSITESQISDLDHTDTDAIHDNVAGEINAVTSKGTPVNGDLLLIEDSEDSNNKKSITIGDLPSSGGGDPDQDLYNSFTDGTNTATAGSTTDTFKFRSANNILSVLVANDDATHGDNLLLTVDETNIDHDNLTNYSADEHFTQASITTVGTVTTGTWEATDVGVSHGGTGASTASGARTNLGLAIGSDVQAHDDILDDLSGLTQASNKVPYFDSATTASTLDFLDEDNMASDSATALASQQSIKAYVDSQVSASLTEEEVQDFAWNVLTGTQTLITVTYDDANNEVDFVVDNDLSNYDNSTSGFFDASSDVDHDSTTNFVANEHVDHSTVSISGGDGLSGGGDITTSRTLNVDINGTTDLVSPATDDELLISDTSNTNAIRKADLASIVNLADHDQLTNYVSGEHFLQSEITETGTVTTGTWSSTVSGATIDADNNTISNLELAAEVTGALTDLSDVDTDKSKTPADGDVLTFDGTDWNAETPSGGGGDTFNNLFIDQSGGTSDTHGTLSGTINGSNTTFTVSQSKYASGTLKVWLNGQLMTEGTSEDYTETTPGSGTFDFATAPVSGDEITVEYQTEELSSDTVITDATTDVSTSSWVIDEDDMSSDLATKVPTQQSVKAYVDSQGGGGASELDDLSDVSLTTESTGDFLRYDGSNFVNTTISSGDVPNLAASKITSGTFDNARISETSVTQHEAAIDHDALTNYVAGEHFLQSAITETGTVTSGTWSSDLAADTVDAITEIASALKSGSDGTLITGTAGTNGDLAQWNVDGDLVDGPTPPTGTIVGTTDTQTLTNKTIDGDNNTVSNLDIGNEVDWANATDVTDRSATPASGDKLLLFEAGVGLRKIDWDDLPSGGGTHFTENADGFEISGGSTTSRTLTVTGGDISLDGSGTVADGEILIGHAGNNEFQKNTLTEGSGISVTNGAGSVTIAASGITTSEIAGSAKTGSDTQVATGTAGTSGNVPQWNADGDVVDSGTASSDIVTPSSTDNLTNKTIDANGTGNNISNLETDDFASGAVSGSGTTLETEFSKAITIESPSASEDISMFETGKAITITEIRAVIRGSSTPDVTWTIRHNSDRSATGNEVVTGGTTTSSTTTGDTITSFNDATIPADSWIWLETTSNNGTVDELNIVVKYTID